MAQVLLNAVTATGAGTAWQARDTSAIATYTQHSFQAVGSTTASTGAATIVIEASNDGTNYVTMATITLTLSTTPSSDGLPQRIHGNFIVRVCLPFLVRALMLRYT